MIINTGLRTDIPAFYTPWLLRRLEEGFVLVRSPYNPRQVTRYRLTPDVVDLLVFCTKNPGPLLPHLTQLAPFGQYWFVTVTPYGPDVEPHVPPKKQVLAAVQRLGAALGPECVAWRYDPILLTEAYTPEYHLREFAAMCRTLAGSVSACVISFIDLYEKVKRNFPAVRPVPKDVQLQLGREMIRLAHDHGMALKTCCEGDELSAHGADIRGCMTIAAFEQALHTRLDAPRAASRSRECACHLSCDIGAYNTCGHLCRYCYANHSDAAVRRAMAQHDPRSPLITGTLQPGDVVRDAQQCSWKAAQITLDDLLL